MLQYIFQTFIIAASLLQNVKAQQYDSLNLLKGYAAKVYYSTGHQQRAEAIAQRTDNAMMYYTKLLQFKPAVTLFILDTSGWKKYTTMGAVYGMPHYDPATQKLFVAAMDNPFWKSFLPPLDKLPETLREQIKTVYKRADGSLSMQAFFDLLAIHELGHSFTGQYGLTTQRKWMGELYPNILLHTYIAENEPELLPALTLFPQMVISAGAKEYKYTSLTDIEDRYGEIGRYYPKNYGWYQCRWHAAAATIYTAGGKQVCKKIWDALKMQKEKLTDEQLTNFLMTNTDKAVADMMQYWDERTIK